MIEVAIKWLEFINNNSVLCSGIFSLLCVLITIMVSVIKDNKNNKIETIRSLKKELSEKTEELNKVKKELEDTISIERAEKNIDKRKGSIYVETLPNGGQRAICGFCWENEHKKIPITVEKSYNNSSGYYYGHCSNCGKRCEENIEEEFHVFLSTDYYDLPF